MRIYVHFNFFFTVSSKFLKGHTMFSSSILTWWKTKEIKMRTYVHLKKNFFHGFIKNFEKVYHVQVRF